MKWWKPIQTGEPRLCHQCPLVGAEWDRYLWETKAELLADLWQAREEIKQLRAERAVLLRKADRLEHTIDFIERNAGKVNTEMWDVT